MSLIGLQLIFLGLTIRHELTDDDAHGGNIAGESHEDHEDEQDVVNHCDENIHVESPSQILFYFYLKHTYIYSITF